jgi:carbon starvation protein CstA
MQAMLWTTIGLVFATAAQRAMVGARSRARATPVGLAASPGD